MDIMTTKDAAKTWGVSTRRVAVLCEEGRIPGAFQLGRTWAIPKDAIKPTDARLKEHKSTNSKEID